MCGSAIREAALGLLTCAGGVRGVLLDPCLNPRRRCRPLNRRRCPSADPASLTAAGQALSGTVQ